MVIDEEFILGHISDLHFSDGTDRSNPNHAHSIELLVDLQKRLADFNGLDCLEPISKPVRCKMLYERGVELCPYSIRRNTKMCLVGDYPIVSGNESNPLFRNRNLGYVDGASTANTLEDVLVPSPAK